MNKELYNLLEKEWKYSNHIKYQKYFKEWIEKLTENQIIGFHKAMESTINSALIQY